MVALLSKPLPLVDKDRKLIVLWSAKSACTTVYVWFAGVCGFLNEVRQYNWPHNHRENIFKKSVRYQESRRADTSDYHVVKVIRDPYTRTASMFRHAIRNGLVKDSSISFQDFLQRLSRMDMENANIHFKPQFHAFEQTRQPDTIINVSKTDLFSELNALEGRMGWPFTDFGSMGWLRELEAARRPPRLTTDGTPYFEVPIVRATPPKSTPFPDDNAFLIPRAKELIEQIYQVDFESYANQL